MENMTLWQQLRFMIVDAWKSRSERRPLDRSYIRAIRDGSHIRGGKVPGAPDSEALEMMHEANEHYLASFERD